MGRKGKMRNYKRTGKGYKRGNKVIAQRVVQANLVEEADKSLLVDRAQGNQRVAQANLEKGSHAVIHVRPEMDFSDRDFSRGL